MCRHLRSQKKASVPKERKNDGSEGAREGH